MIDTEALVHGIGIFHLCLVVLNATRCLVMQHQIDTFFLGIGGYRFDIEKRLRFGKAEQVGIGYPVTIPANIPAFHQKPIEAVFSDEVDVTLGLLGGCTQGFAGSPAVLTDMHTPPDTHVDSGLYPGHIAQLIGLVQIEDEV